MSASLPGSELTREPFRWDQRLFSLVLRIPGVANTDNDRGPGSSLVNTDDSPINAMCEVTGGKVSCLLGWYVGLSVCNCLKFTSSFIAIHVVLLYHSTCMYAWFYWWECQIKFLCRSVHVCNQKYYQSMVCSAQINCEFEMVHIQQCSASVCWLKSPFDWHVFLK